MFRPLKQIYRRWWYRRFHPMTRIGWAMATSGKSRTTTMTLAGLGLAAAGLFARPKGQRNVLYRGTIEPGSTTRIRVLSNDTVIHDATYEG
ncbi:MAG: hypothetical protein ABFR95_04915 [Actinomycetota bacterium]